MIIWIEETKGKEGETVYLTWWVIVRFKSQRILLVGVGDARYAKAQSVAKDRDGRVARAWARREDD